jgi:AcrR family transcriptional regulator
MTERKDQILDAAIALADERGMDAVSMRTVAERVGVTPMALYPHVGSKAALLEGMLGRVLGELNFAAGTDAYRPSWQDRLNDLGHAARALVRRRPWVAALIFARPSVAPDAARVVDEIYQALLDAGVPEAEVPRLERLVSTFVIGYAASEAAGRFGPAGLDLRVTRGQLPGGELPGHARVADWLSPLPDWDAEFDADMADLERLIEARARPQRAR